MIRAIRNLYKDFLTFGNPELERLKHETKQLQEQLVQLKKLRAERERQEELIALARLRATAEQLQHIDATTKAAGEQVTDQLEDLTEQVKPELEAMAAAEVQAKAEEAMRHLHLEDFYPAAQTSGAAAATPAVAADPAANSPAASAAGHTGRTVLPTEAKSQTAGGKSDWQRSGSTSGSGDSSVANGKFGGSGGSGFGSSRYGGRSGGGRGRINGSRGRGGGRGWHGS